MAESIFMFSFKSSGSMHSAAVATFAQASHRGKPQKQCMRKSGFEAESLDRERTSEEKMSLVGLVFFGYVV